MRTLRGKLVLITILVFAASVFVASATALAQSAGDDQYVDPFQDGTNEPQGGGGGNSGSQGGSGGGGQNGSTTPPSTTEQPPASEAEAAEAQVGGDTATESGSALPRSGLALAGPAGAGLLLLAGGLALRRRT